MKHIQIVVLLLLLLFECCRPLHQFSFTRVQVAVEITHAQYTCLLVISPALYVSAKQTIAEGMTLAYAAVAHQIRQGADLLHLSYQPIATALVFLHRFKEASNEAYPDTVSLFVV